MAYSNYSSCSLKALLQSISGLAIGFVVLTSLIPLYIISFPVFALRFILCRLSKLLRPDLSHAVSPLANLFVTDLFSRNSPRCVIVVPIVIEGRDTDDAYLKKFRGMVNNKNYKEFKQYITHWYGFPFWTTDRNFELKNHIKFYESENKTVIDKEVSLLVERLLNKQFHPRNRSPWEVYIVRNYEDPELKRGDKTVFVMRFHHSLADGYSILYAIIEGFLKYPLSAVPLPEPNYVKRSQFDLLFMATFPFRLIYDAACYFGKGALQNPWIIPDVNKNWKQLYGKSKHVPIERIKEIKSELNVSFTGVLLAALAGSVARSFRVKGLRADSNTISCFIPLPLPGHPSALKNHVTGAQVALPLQDDMSPILRVRMCEELLQEQKSSTIPFLLHFLGRTLGLQFSSVCGFLTPNRTNPIALTNFPAGNSEIKTGLKDGKVLAVDLAVGGLPGVTGVVIMAISYVDHIRFAITAESSVMSRNDVDNFLHYICDEIDLLHTLVVAQDN